MTDLKKDKREYYVLAGDINLLKYMKHIGLKLNPLYFMIIKESSEIGKLIKKEAIKRLDNGK